ncbi:MAG: hypothetical protein ACJA0N_002331 [Pseudohongiellaceae bacterium]|jgi:hypothetical protein
MLKLQFKDNPDRGFWLVGEQLSLGASDDCDVVLEGLGINDLHAFIKLDGDVVRLLPCDNSTCHINNSVAGEQLLVEGDELRIGKERLMIVDPKQSNQQVEPPQNPSGVKNSKIWTLTAEHPKLKDRPFLITGKSILGRSKDVDLFIPFKHLSREHAELTVEGDVLSLKDLGSSNGCFVNGERVQAFDLTGGETVSFAFLDFVVNSPLTPKEPDVEMDVTMMRSAIKQEDIERAQQESNLHSQPLDLSEIEQQFDDGSKKTSSIVWISVAVVALLALVYGGYQYFV